METVINQFSVSFVHKELREKRERILYEREQALLPVTQEEVRVEANREELKGLRALISVYERINRPADAAILREREARILADTGDVLPAFTPQPSTAPRNARPVCGCIRDTCRGFVLNSTWACGMCNTKVCKECLKEETEGHTCTEEDRETRNLLLNNTKPCPSCGAMISKVDGCNQMWCIMCHTAFDWVSGQVVRTGIHNPHYYEWMRRTRGTVPRAQEPQEFVCAGLNQLPEAHMFQARITRYTAADREMLMNCHRLALHINTVEIPRNRVEFAAQDNRDLRLKFLKNEIEEDDFKRQVFLRERRRDRKTALRQVFEVFYAHLREVLVEIHNNRPNFTQHKEGLLALADYCNQQFARTARMYNVKAYRIAADFSGIERAT
jgi:hypothetical protein